MLDTLKSIQAHNIRAKARLIRGNSQNQDNTITKVAIIYQNNKHLNEVKYPNDTKSHKTIADYYEPNNSNK